MKHYLFTYGTLMPGQAPLSIAPIVRRLRPVGKGCVRGDLFDLGSYPGAVLNNYGGRVCGQVLELPDDPEVLRRLDAYEEFDPKHPQRSEFVREKCTVFRNSGRSLEAWIYKYNRPPRNAPRIEAGDFVASRKQRPSGGR